MGAIEKTESSKDQFISCYFLVPKPDGSSRFILNLAKFNEFVNIEHLKLEDIRTAINLLERGDFMCSLDLNDALMEDKIQEKSNIGRTIYHCLLISIVSESTLRCRPFNMLKKSK